MINLEIDGTPFPEPSEWEPLGPEDAQIKMADGGSHASVQDFGWVIRGVWGKGAIKAASASALVVLVKGKHLLTWTDPLTSTTYTDIPVILLRTPTAKIIDNGTTVAPIACTFYGRSLE